LGDRSHARAHSVLLFFHAHAQANRPELQLLLVIHSVSVEWEVDELDEIAMHQLVEEAPKVGCIVHHFSFFFF
jgi:hypothetical protein